MTGKLGRGGRGGIRASLALVVLFIVGDRSANRMPAGDYTIRKQTRINYWKEVSEMERSKHLRERETKWFLEVENFK